MSIIILNCIFYSNNKDGNRQETLNGMEDDDSETELPVTERPCIIRTLEGWHYLNRGNGRRAYYGSLEIGLNYDPNLSKIILAVSYSLFCLLHN